MNSFFSEETRNRARFGLIVAAGAVATVGIGVEYAARVSGSIARDGYRAVKDGSISEFDLKDSAHNNSDRVIVDIGNKTFAAAAQFPKGSTDE